MGRKSIYSEEERAQRRAIAQARYRLSKGVKVGLPPGRPPAGQVRTIADYAPKVVQQKSQIILPKRQLSAHASADEIREWIIEVCDSLSKCDNPAAWASAASIMQRNLELLIKLEPPKPVEPKKRPRCEILIDENENDGDTE